MPSIAGKPPSKRRVKPYAQGDLDSLCGIYAIINAFRALCREISWEISTQLFQHLVRCLNRHTKQALFPIIFGTGNSLMRKLLGEAQSYLKKRLEIALAIEPKGRELKSKSLEAAWQHLSAIVDEATVLILPQRPVGSLDGLIRHKCAKNSIGRFEPPSRAYAVAVHPWICKKALLLGAFGRDRDQAGASLISHLHSRNEL